MGNCLDFFVLGEIEERIIMLFRGDVYDRMFVKNAFFFTLGVGSIFDMPSISIIYLSIFSLMEVTLLSISKLMNI